MFAAFLSMPFFNNFFKPYDRTALHIAVARNNLEMVKYLIENGANPKLRDSDYLTPLDFAKIKGFKDIKDLLLSFK